jgi:hypothetical protein
VLVARLMHELGYQAAEIRTHFVKMPERRGLAEHWWRLAHGQASEATSVRGRPAGGRN